MAQGDFFTTQRAGNWSRQARFHDSPWWSSDEEILGSDLEFSYPGDGWTVIVRHNLTVDADIIIGLSLQAALWEPLQISTTGGDAVTQLATGNYTLGASVLSANGETQLAGTISSPFTLTSGVSKPRVTFADNPPVSSDYRLYLNNNSGGNVMALYCSGIIGTTVDLVSGFWGNTWVGGAATGGAVSNQNSTSPPPPAEANAVTVKTDGAIIIAPGKKLLIRGDFIAESPTGSTKPFLQVGAGATFRPDPSMAVDPTRAAYLMNFQGGGDIRYLG